jgi:peptide/nickel transport system substrate-binding protein
MTVWQSIAYSPRRVLDFPRLAGTAAGSHEDVDTGALHQDKGVAMQSSSHPRRRGVGAAVAALSLLAVTACTGGSGDDSSGQTAGTGTAPTTLALGVTRAPSTLDPVQLATGTDTLIWGSVYDTLFVIGPDGELVPHMAESYEYNEDGTELTITLRDDLTFSDGEPATASDYAATVEHIRDTPGAGQAMMSNVESVEAPDDTTAVIHFTANDPGFLFDLTSRAGIIAVPEQMSEESYGLDPIGAGPYVLDVDSSQPGTTYVLNKRDDHWNADAYPFEQLTVRVIQDSTATENALRTGELDIATIAQQSVPQFTEPQFTVLERGSSNSIFIDIADREGTIQPALADLRVRQAINMAFDREAMVESLAQGVGQPTEQMFFPTTDGHDPDLDGTYEYDPEGAKELLAEAGYPEGFAVDMPSIVYTQTFEPAVTQALADIGITVNWVSIPPQDTVSAVMSGTYPLIMWFATVLPAPSQVEDYFGATALLNPLRTSDPELDALLAEASQVVGLDPEAGDIYRQINAWSVENAWFAPLYFTGETIAAAEGYAYIGTDNQQSVRIESYGLADQ